ncbi:MAG TPA: carboxymuconolactone decarboxylase family protein [Micromonosporaceae bacterium]
MSTDIHHYRFEPLLPERMSAEQRAVYDEITAGPRARGPQLFRLVEADGTLTGPFDAMLRSPDVGMALQRLGAALRYRGVLTDREREVGILAVAACRGSGYEWYAHEPAARGAGVPDEDLARLRRGEFGEVADERDRAIATACAQLLQHGEMSDDTLACLGARMTDAGLAELVVLVGYYNLLALLMSALRAPLPRGVADPFAG